MQSEDGLLGRVVRGTAWAAVGHAGTVLFPILRNLILIPFLSPTQFGLWAALTTVMGILRVFSDMGIHAALVQRHEGDREDFLTTVWFVQVLRGILLTVLTFLAAGPAAWFFQDQTLVRPFQVMALLFLLNGIASPRLALLLRDMNFRKISIMEQFAGITSLVVAVVLGIWWSWYPPGFPVVWALVIAELVHELSLLVIGYLVAPFRPTFQVVRAHLYTLWDFGKPLYLANVAEFLLWQGDYLVVGRLCGPALLGQYRMGWQFAHLPGLVVATLTRKVLFPTYAHIQDQPARVASAYRRVLSITACYAWPAALGLLFLAPVLPRYAGSQWKDAVVPMQIMCLAGLAHTINASAIALFLGIGRGPLLARITVFNLLALAVFIIPFTWLWNIQGAASAVVIAQLLTSVVVFTLLHRQLVLSWNTLARTVLTPIPATTAMTTALFVLTYLEVPWPVYLALVLMVGSTVYLAVLWFTAPGPIADLKLALNKARHSVGDLPPRTSDRTGDRT